VSGYTSAEMTPYCVQLGQLWAHGTGGGKVPDQRYYVKKIPCRIPVADRLIHT